MKLNQLTILAAAVLALLFVATGMLVFAQSSADFNLGWNVVGSGGETSSSADFVVHGTIGQFTASESVMSSADFRVSGGFWHAETPGGELFLPSISR